jgi:hypothetical protein
MNKVIIDQIISFHKSNKKVWSEKMMDQLVPKTKHPIRGLGRAQISAGGYLSVNEELA